MLFKHPKKELCCCTVVDCFHPATSEVDGSWFCNCHHPLFPSQCTEQKLKTELISYRKSGDCSFCGTSNSRNAFHGIDGKITFVCEACYRTPIGVIRKYWKG